MSIALVAWLLACPVWGADASAVEIAVVGGHIEGLSLADNERMTKHLAEALNATGSFSVLEPDELSVRLRGRRDLVLSDYASGRGMEWLEEGRVLAGRFLFDQAIPALQRATRAFEEGVLLTGDVNLLAESWLELGLAHAGYGQPEEAMQAFRRVVTLQPGRELSEIEYPPKFVRLFGAVRDGVLAEPSGSLQIEMAGPGEYEVEVDGRRVGIAPVDVVDLPPGRHFLRAVGEGMERVQGVITLDPGERRELLLEPKPGGLGRVAETENGRARQVEALYTTLGRYAEVPMLLIAGETGRGELALVLFSVELGMFSKALWMEGADTNDLVRLVPELEELLSDTGGIKADRVDSTLPGFDLNSNSVLSRLLLAPPTPMVTTPSPPAAGRTNWILWAGAGAVAVGGVTAIAVVAASNDDTPPAGTIIFGPLP